MIAHDQLILALITAVVALVNTALTAWLHQRNHHEHRGLSREIKNGAKSDNHE